MDQKPPPTATPSGTPAATAGGGDWFRLNGADDYGFKPGIPPRLPRAPPDDDIASSGRVRAAWNAVDLLAEHTSGPRPEDLSQVQRLHPLPSCRQVLKY